MIKLIEQTLSVSSLAELAKYQAKINAQSAYENKVVEAQNLWKPRNKTFDEVTEKLIAMCPGTRRCCYCEDARAEDIEHFHPKNFYPEMTFQWENYLYACSACNSNAKREQFAVFDADGTVLDVMRAKGAPVIPPPPGDPVLINPRYENPFDFLMIEFVTFLILPRRHLNPRDMARADYTIKILALNSRAELVDWRKKAFRIFIGWMDTYRRYKEAQDMSQLDDHVHDLRSYNHLAVWLEMQRVYRNRDLQHWETLKKKNARIADLDALFTQLPELVDLELV